MATPQIGTATATPTSLKLRVLAIRDRLPANVRSVIRERFSDLDTAKGAKKIDNVLSGGSSDERVTEFLESLVQPVAA
ncbi:MAG: hypothetical protein ACRYFZ_01780 [Janthinobacterium lividum]